MALIPSRDASLPWLKKPVGTAVYVTPTKYYYVPQTMEAQRRQDNIIDAPKPRSSLSSHSDVTMTVESNRGDPFSEIAQRMVDEQLSGCKSFKSKIEESLQELHQQWNRRSVRPRTDDNHHSVRTEPGLILPRSPLKNPLQRKHILYDEGLDHHIDPDHNTVIVSHRMLSSSTHKYVPLRPTEATKTCILKPTLVSNEAYDDWNRSSVICKTPPHRVPAKRLLSCNESEMMQSTPRLVNLSLDRHSVKLESLRDDGSKSAFSTYSNNSPSSPPSRTEEPRSCSPRSDSSGDHIMHEKEAVVRVKTEPGIYVTKEQVNRHYNGTIVQCANIDSSGSVSRLLGLARVANEQLGVIQATPVKIQKRRTKGKGNDCLHLWEFLRDLLNQNDQQTQCIEWTCRERGEFRLIKTAMVAKLWGKSKNRHQMTYEKMARAMRYYYKMNILEKVPNKRLHFRFGNHMLPKVVCEQS